MKKTIISIALSVSLFVNTQANEKVELLPELKELITPKPLDPKLLENNLFVALMGSTYPHDDYYEVAQKALLESYENILKALPANDFMPDSEMLSVIEKAYQKLNAKDNWQWQGNWREQRLQMPCDQYLHPNCIIDTIQNKAEIRTYTKDNQPLIERHDDIFAKYHAIHWINLPREAMAMAPFPAFQNFMHVSDLALAEGVLEISEGNVDRGMDIFITWQKNINHLVSEESTSGLLPLMIAVARQQVLDQYVNALLDSEYAPKIAHRLAELTDLQLIYSQTIRDQAFKTIKFEFIDLPFGLSEIYLASQAEALAKHPAEGMVLTKKEALNALTHLDFQKNSANDWLVFFDQDKLKALLIKELGESALDPSMKLNPKYSDDDYMGYFAKTYPLSAELNLYYTESQEYYRLFKLDPYGIETAQFANNMCGKLLNKLVMMGCERDRDLDYLKRADIGLNYHNMVYLKIQMMLNNIDKKNLSEFLNSQGDLAIDPITKESFRWNDETKVLSLPLNEPEYSPAPIRNRVKENPAIKNLEVMIPSVL